MNWTNNSARCQKIVMAWSHKSHNPLLMFLSSVMSDGASQSVFELRILPVLILIETPDTEILIGNGILNGQNLINFGLKMAPKWPKTAPKRQLWQKYIKYIVQDSFFKTFWCTFSHRNGSNLPLILYFNLEAFRGRVTHRFAFLEFFSP